jgi:hypothetical protein
VSGWLQYDLGQGHAQVVERYAVTSSIDKVPRDPKDWQFQGSNDGSSWTTLDTQSNQTFAERYQMKTYAVVSPASYRYYRLNITANNGDAAFTDLSELGLWASQ